MKLKYNLYIFWAVIGLCCISCSNKDDDHIPPAIQEPEKPTAPEIYNDLGFTPHVDGEPFNTYRGLVMAGYQGWRSR